MKFQFELKQLVKIIESGERGKVIARAQYMASEDTYLIRYMAADGRAVEQWWADSALEKAYPTGRDMA